MSLPEIVQRLIDAGVAARQFDAVPADHLAVVTCMDVRIEPNADLGIQRGRAHLLRTAGGRVTEDVRRSLYLSTWAFGVTDVVVAPHTDCGLGGTEAALRAKVAAAGAPDWDGPLWTFTSPEDAARGDVEALAGSGLLPPGTRLHALVVDVEHGETHHVATLEA